MLECLEYEEGGPYDGFEKAQHPYPETGGIRNEIHGRPDKTEAVHRSTRSIALYSFAHGFLLCAKNACMMNDITGDLLNGKNKMTG
jgi:hypothetical protein